MPSGPSMRPQRWRNTIDLFDDGKTSTAWGTTKRTHTDASASDGTPRKRSRLLRPTPRSDSAGSRVSGTARVHAAQRHGVGDSGARSDVAVLSVVLPRPPPRESHSHGIEMVYRVVRLDTMATDQGATPGEGERR